MSTRPASARCDQTSGDETSGALSAPDSRTVTRAVETAHRRHWPAVVAATARVTRDLDLAEDCAQDAYVQALRHWADGAPDNPAAWLITVARRTALDRMRREAIWRRKLPLLVVPDDAGETADESTPSDPLRLVFTCCHPALAREAQLTLTLRLLCGLTTGEIARVLLVKETAVAARITRAKQKISAAGVPFRLPYDDELPARLDTVLTVIHVAYTAGHTAAGIDLTRPDVTDRAIGLARMLVADLPGEPEVHGLLALLLFAEARRPARISPSGKLVLLADQDRSLWDRRKTTEALVRATAALKQGDGRFTLQAAIAGLHAVAPSWEATDWRQIGQMYDALALRWPNPVVALNRAAAQSLTPGADLTDVLAVLDALAADPMLDGYAYLPATRADVLARLGRRSEAQAAYDAAIAATANESEREFLRQRRSHL